MDIEPERKNEIMQMAKEGLTEEEKDELLDGNDELWLYNFYKEQFDYWKETGQEDLIDSYDIPC